jgi:hypothetical protein
MHAMEQMTWGWWLVAALWFGGGWGWGQWWAERCARRDKAAMERGRLNVSMPVDPDQASETLRVLSVLMKQVEAGEPTLDSSKTPNVLLSRARDGV